LPEPASQTLGFLEKNRDLLSQDIVEVMQNSTDALLADLFDPGQVEDGRSLKQGEILPFLPLSPPPSPPKIL